MLAQANRLLSPLNRKVVFLGGATVHLHVDDPSAAPVRTTKDVDVVVAAVNYTDFTEVEAELRGQGFEQTFMDGPICRWTKDGLLVDIIPSKPEILGFSKSKWFQKGFDNSVEHGLAGGEKISIFDVLHLMAAKIEAFQERGEGDLFASRDFEDIAAILDGSTIVWDQLGSDSEVAEFVRTWLGKLSRSECEDALAGHIGSYERAELLGEKIDALRA